MSKPFDMHKFVHRVANRVFLDDMWEENEHPRGQGGKFSNKGNTNQPEWYRGRKGEWKKTKQGMDYFVPVDITPDEQEGLLDKISMGIPDERFEGDDEPGIDMKTGEYVDDELYLKSLENMDQSGGMNSLLQDINSDTPDEYHAEPFDEEPESSYEDIAVQTYYRKMRGLKSKEDRQVYGKLARKHHPEINWDEIDEEFGF